jgi:hypothetical protein
MWNMLGNAMTVPSLQFQPEVCSKPLRYPSALVMGFWLREQLPTHPRGYAHLIEQERDCSTSRCPWGQSICPTAIGQLSTMTAFAWMLQG